MVVTQFNLYKYVCFCKYGHNSGQNESPDVILTALDVKFHETTKFMKTNNVEKVGPNKVEKNNVEQVGS